MEATALRRIKDGSRALEKLSVPSSGAITIMFTDIEGSTEITERLGDQVALALLQEHDRIIRRELDVHNGAELKHLGDGFMLAFGCPRAAVGCAVALQASFARFNQSCAAAQLLVRCGLSVGEPVCDGGDLFGRPVILAARIVRQARGGEILVSSRLRELVDGACGIALGPGREVELKGLSGRHEVFDVLWQISQSQAGATGEHSA